MICSLGGNDSVYGLAGNDTIERGAGDDTIDGGDSDNVLNGGDGGDLFVGSTGSDTIDGGAGTDAVIYYTDSEDDYTITAITETTTRGKRVIEEIVGYEVTPNDGSGDVDVITNVDSVTVFVGPAPGAIITQGDFSFVDRDAIDTINVLENDDLEAGNLGEGLTVTAILDIRLEIDNDGQKGTDYIYESIPFDGCANGVTPSDGSILTVLADGTMTWDPNDLYDTDTGETPSISCWYKASGGATTAYGDVTFAVTYPALLGDIDFETVALALDPITAKIVGYNYDYDGPNESDVVSQLTNATNFFELRDVAASGDYDYDKDGDDGFRVWTDADGTTHEMNITHEFSEPFDLGGMTITGLDAGEEAIFTFADASGNAVGAVTVTAEDLTGDNILEVLNATNVEPLSVEAGAGDAFCIDEIFFL